jgi:hypothetical protein
MKFELLPFSENINFSISASSMQKNGRLIIRYEIKGPISTLSLSPQNKTEPIWKSSCLELFLSTGDTSYDEFNISLDGRVESYSFFNYRELEEKAKTLCTINKTETTATSILLEISVVKLSSDKVIGNLSAIIEEVNGEKSYWSLQHSSEKPDFHNSHFWKLLI